MFKSLLRDRLFIFLLLLVVAIRLFSLNEVWVENYYTYGFYPYFSGALRMLAGWIPFSIGDIFYIAAFIFLVVKAWKMINLLAKRRVKEYLSWILFRKYLRLVLWIYIVFNIFWGLNYNRVGIAGQLGLDVKTYSIHELGSLTELLRNKLNYYAAQIDSVNRLNLNQNKNLFQQASNDFEKAAKQYSFLRYQPLSMKPSLFGAWGKYFGYTGYYNPFTGEAQIKSSIPVFMKPFVANHEIAHQLGYAKENEASFVSFLAGKNSESIAFRYSIYYELFFDAFRQLMSKDNIQYGVGLIATLHPRVKYDVMDERNYSKRNRNFMAPYMSVAYDKFLKLNNQPKGKATYDEVIAWLIAYMKKYGPAAI